MFERGGVSLDYLKADPNIDSAKALVGQTAGVSGPLSPDELDCPTYSPTSGTCSAGTLTAYHYNAPPSKPFTYTAACKTRYTGSSSKTSTLTVNTYLQCLDACDVSFLPFVRAASNRLLEK